MNDILPVVDTLEYIENEENYLHMIKDKCFLCNGPTPKTWKHYKVMGNCCVKCSSRLSNNLRGRGINQ